MNIIYRDASCKRNNQLIGKLIFVDDIQVVLIIDVVLVLLLLTLNIFHTFFQYFYRCLCMLAGLRQFQIAVNKRKILIFLQLCGLKFQFELSFLQKYEYGFHRWRCRVIFSVSADVRIEPSPSQRRLNIKCHMLIQS